MIQPWFPVLLAVAVAATCAPVCARPAVQSAEPLAKFVETHCLACHDTTTSRSGLALDKLVAADLEKNPKAWESVLRRLTARQMPPKGSPRPTEQEYDTAVSRLESVLDRLAEKTPRPGRTETFRRLNRTEYQNAIRDLLGLEVDVTALLPAEELSHGFDNVTVADLSPILLGRYVSAARKISRLAVGGGAHPVGDTFRIRPDVTQDVHIEGLPIGTRGGTLIPFNFPQDGEYEIQVRLMRDRNEGVEGLSEAHDLEVVLDRERRALFTIKPPRAGESSESVDAHLKVRIPVKAGPHRLAVAFLKQSSSLQETARQPLNVHFNFYRHPRLGPAVYEVSIVGPYEATGPGDTPSRRRIFSERPSGPNDEGDCAKRLLSKLARRAYRRPVKDEDLQPLLHFFRGGREESGFEVGIERALSAILVNPNFLFRIERDPPGALSGSVHRIDPVELASRLSYFLWSSLPDDELLELAERGELSQAEVLEQQTLRMLADDRARNLVTNFGGQWLHLRNLDAAVPDMRLFPDFDDNLRTAFRRETELFFENVWRGDRGVLELLQANHTYLNERLARHYGIPHVHGSRFRRVNLDEGSERGGLLRHGSLLTVTSYATRTSPVIRGHWVLKNFVGLPPPPPPPDVPALKDNTVSSLLPMRERLREHRANAACAGCHQQMDPVGFSLENFDAVGRWRMVDGGQPIDVAGSLTDGAEFTGVAGLEQALLNRPELFVRTMTENLLTFGLGRGVEWYDAAAIRQIVRDARVGDHRFMRVDYRFSRLIVGIVLSTPFQMRTAP